MTDIYELLQPKKGYAYKDNQIIDVSLVNTPIPHGKKLKGNSRIIGDVSNETYRSIVDLIISLCSRFNLDYKETAYTLLICMAESGYNPDAAAGTTSASGLAQYTRGTADAFKTRSKEILGIEIDMSGMNVFDTTIGAYGVLVAFLFNRGLAIKWGFKPNDEKYWQLIYMLHHDGPGYYNDDRGKERALRFKWRDDAVKTYERIFKSKLLLLTNLLKQKVETKLKLTDSDGKSIANKNYILATTENSSNEKPSHLSMDRGEKNGVNVVYGKTNSQGESLPILSKIGDEIISILLPDNFRSLINTNNVNDYTIKKGDTLGSIARRNNTTVEKIARDNNLKNINQISIGQKLKLDEKTQYVVKNGDNLTDIAKRHGTTIEKIINDNKIENPNNIAVGQKININKYLNHRPANSALKDIFGKIGLVNLNLNILTFSKNHTAKPKNSTTSSTNKSTPNLVELRTLIDKSGIDQKNQAVPKKEKNETQSNGNNKNVKVDITNGMAVIYTFQENSYGFNETPKKGYTVFYDHFGNKIISFKSGNKVASTSKSGADGPFSGYFTYTSGGLRSSDLGNAYGTTKIRSTDERARWVHGGGSGLKNPMAEKQGWKGTLGCTRAQNIDLENLAQKITEFKKKYPKVKIKYIRDTKGTYPQ